MPRTLKAQFSVHDTLNIKGFSLFFKISPEELRLISLKSESITELLHYLFCTQALTLWSLCSSCVCYMFHNSHLKIDGPHHTVCLQEISTLFPFACLRLQLHQCKQNIMG